MQGIDPPSNLSSSVFLPPEWLEHARSTIERLGPLEGYHSLIAENDALIREPELLNGRTIVGKRSALHHELVGHWARNQHRRLGYDKPFAVVALGGTGRAEIAPGSDLDFALLVDDGLDGNSFILELQGQVMASGEFDRTYGFTFQPLVFNLEDAPLLLGKQLNSFLDLQPIYDPNGLSERFRDRIRATYDSFEHFLHVRGFWLGKWEKAASDVDRLDSFDIKNDGLRVFLAGIWTLAGKRFSHAHAIYSALEDPRDLDAYHFLIRIRCFVHLRHPNAGGGSGGNHPEDVLRFDDFVSFHEMLGPQADEWARHEFTNDVRARILSARRRIARFTKAVIDRELKSGREASPGTGVIYGIGGLRRGALEPGLTPQEKSRAALSLLRASQHYGVPIDPAELLITFRHAGDWMVPVAELASLFYEQRGSLADSLAFLSQFDGAEDRLFPGYSRFEASLDARVVAERKLLRGALEREKMRALEGFVQAGLQKLALAISPKGLTDLTREIDVTIEAAMLDADHLAAVKLALKTKRLPLTPQDLELRADPSRSLQERYSTGLSDIPLADYYLRYQTDGAFPEDTVRIARSLVMNRRAFKDRADEPNDGTQVEAFAQLCGDEQFLRALFVFTCADRAQWESARDDPARWDHSRELYFKTMMRFRPPMERSVRIQMLGCPAEVTRILEDLGDDFWGGQYRQHASAFASALSSLAEEQEAGKSKVILLSGGAAPMIGVAARDYRGLAASITGALWHQGFNLRQAHLFSSMHFGVVLDFFYLIPGTQALGRYLLQSVEESIQRQLYIAETDEATLPVLHGRTVLDEWRPGQYRLRHETRADTSGLVYALAYKVYRHLRGNIFSLVAHAVRGNAYVSLYHSLPPDLSLANARQVVEQHFG